MRVAFFTYAAAFQDPGGGEVQLTKTREHLLKAGVLADLFDPWSSKLDDYDLLHVFSSVDECLGLARAAKARGLRVVTSPVLWSDARRALRSDGGPRERAELSLRHFLKVAWPTFPSGRRRLLALSDRLFPNSEAEKRQIARLFAIDPRRIRVVPNGVDADFAAGADPAPFRARYGEAPFVLSVGRIEPRKNQLNLVRAMKGLGTRLVLLGDPVGGYEDYAARCREEGKGFTTFAPAVPHGDPLLKSAYAACAAFVLPAWFETPGLAALEAALCGAKLVVTSGGSTREYFGDAALYLDPSDPARIAARVREALDAPARPDAAARVRASYTWDRVAAETLAGYREALAS